MHKTAAYAFDIFKKLLHFTHSHSLVFIIVFSISSLYTQCREFFDSDEMCTSCFNCAYTNKNKIKAILNLIKSLKYNLRSYELYEMIVEHECSSQRVCISKKYRIQKCLYEEKSGDVFRIKVYYLYNFDEIFLVA